MRARAWCRRVGSSFTPNSPRLGAPSAGLNSIQSLQSTVVQADRGAVASLSTGPIGRLPLAAVVTCGAGAIAAGGGAPLAPRVVPDEEQHAAGSLAVAKEMPLWAGEQLHSALRDLSQGGN